MPLSGNHHPLRSSSSDRLGIWLTPCCTAPFDSAMSGRLADALPTRVCVFSRSCWGG
jgi:hypothetical protein